MKSAHLTPAVLRQILLRTALFLVLAASGCAAPGQLTHHRSPLLYPELKPFVPEGRIRHIPTESDIEADRAASLKEEGGGSDAGRSDSEEAGSKDGSGAASSPVPADVNGGLLVSPSGADGESIAKAAREKVGASTVNYPNQKRFNEDCSGFVRSVYWSAGVDLFAGGTRRDDNGVTAIYRFIYARGGIHQDTPQPGDLVFYQDTADTNRDGRWNDGLTHIGIVDKVAMDGTVIVIHRNSRGIVREHMNLERPDDRKDESGQVINDYIRGQPSPKFLSQLFYRYGTVLAPEKTSGLLQALSAASMAEDSASKAAEETSGNGASAAGAQNSQ